MELEYIPCNLPYSQRISKTFIIVKIRILDAVFVYFILNELIIEEINNIKLYKSLLFMR